MYNCNPYLPGVKYLYRSFLPVPATSFLRQPEFLQLHIFPYLLKQQQHGYCVFQNLLQLYEEETALHYFQENFLTAT